MSQMAEDFLPRARDPLVKARDVAHVRFVRKNLDQATRFLADFGLRVGQRSDEVTYLHAEAGFGPAIILRNGASDKFDGLALYVASEDELRKLADLPGSSGMEPAENWPEGKQVRLTDPAGNEVRALFGPEPDRPVVRDVIKINAASERGRVNDMQRPPLRPSTVLRLGHCVLTVLEFQRTARWYMATFGLVPSDVQTLPDGDAGLVFLRCDRGDEPTDHHTLVIAHNVVNGFSHAAFEVIDMDDIAMGQEHMKGRGWKHAWGLGRHLLGSQLFDYWRDPAGDKFEHFCDSDLFTVDQPGDVMPLTMAGLYQWGPPLPHDFEMPKLTPGFLLKVIRNVRNSEEMSFGKMRKLLKVAGEKPRDWAK